jgi:carbonic anhydrase/acetyltransferase-like protein (isoleucine patch superfamily)
MTLYALNGRQPKLEGRDIWIAPSADVIGEAILSAGVSIWFRAIIRADNTPITIGNGSNIQDGAVLHSDPGSPLTIGNNVTVGHQAILHGCTVENDVLIGMGAIILNGALIGEGSIVGAGALVFEAKRFPPRSLIVGSPAVRKNTIDLTNAQDLRAAARLYVSKGRDYATMLTKITNE